MKFNGMISIVVGDYARATCRLSPPYNVGIYEFYNTRFRRLETAEIIARFRLVDEQFSVLDLRN